MKRILAVDDSAMSLRLINGLLCKLYDVDTANSGAAALKYLENNYPDLILLDIDMPIMSGIDLMKILKKDEFLSEIPIIFLTALKDTASEALAFELGAVDYIHKPVNSVVLLSRVKLHLEIESYRKDLQRLVEVKTSQITLLQKTTMGLLAYVTEFRDRDTGNHVKRTVEYVTAIMDRLRSKEREGEYKISLQCYEDIKNSTPLHDLGKISIPDSILMKPGQLDPDEFEIMTNHVKSGADLLKNAISELSGKSFLDIALDMVLTHHEKWDGTGYPAKLKGRGIPISGRIMAIADVYDALTSKRPYKPAYTHEKAMKIIEENSGKHFDPELVREFLAIQDEIVKIVEKYKED